MWYVFLWSTPGAEGRIMGAPYSGTPIEKAGIKEGDILVSVDDIPADSLQFLFPNGSIVLGRKGRPTIDVIIRRNSVEIKFSIALKILRGEDGKVIYAPAPTEEQLAVRSAWLAKQEY